MTPDQVLRRPILLTEKAHKLSTGSNKYTFRVSLDANKIEIRDAVQAMFKVKVVDVNTLINRGKDKRMGRGYAKRPNWKKAVVTLKDGDKIDFFDDTPAEKTEG